jgi:hypothetical protein
MTAEDSVLSFPAADLLLNDAEGPPNESVQNLSVVSVQGAVNGSVGLADGTVTFTPAANFNGSANFGYTIRDDGVPAQEASGTVTVTVSSVNDAPVAADDAETTPEDTTLNASVPTASDVDGDAVSYALVAGTTGLSFNPNGSYSGRE